MNIFQVLSSPAYMIMLIMYENTPMRQIDLTKKSQMSRSNLIYHLRSLIHTGLVTQKYKIIYGDTREKIYKLTPRGMHVLRAIKTEIITYSELNINLTSQNQ